MTDRIVKLDELSEAVDEMRQFENSAKNARVKDILSIELRKLETELLNFTAKEIEKIRKDTDKSITIKEKTPKIYTVKLTDYAWDQSDKYVKIFVHLKDVQNIPGDRVSCNFGDRSMQLSVLNLDGKNYSLPITNLLEDINTNDSFWKVKRDNVIVMLCKKLQGSKWSHVTSAERKVADARGRKQLASAGMDESSGSDPAAGIMKLMQQMYQDGDDDMKREIAKAWVESAEKRNTI